MCSPEEEDVCVCVFTSRRMLWEFQHDTHQEEEETNPVNTMCIIMQVVINVHSLLSTHILMLWSHTPKNNSQIIRRSRVKSGKVKIFEISAAQNTHYACNECRSLLISCTYCWLISLHTNVCRIKSLSSVKNLYLLIQLVPITYSCNFSFFTFLNVNTRYSSLIVVSDPSNLEIR